MRNAWSSGVSTAHKRVTAELAAERNRFVASISDEVLILYAAPGSNTEALFHELIASEKRAYTFESQANRAMISSGAVPIAPDFFTHRHDRKAGRLPVDRRICATVQSRCQLQNRIHAA